MSMQDNPCSGYLVKASAFNEMLCPRDRRDYAEALDNCDWEAALKIIENVLPVHCPKPSQIFELGDEDTGDGELEPNVPYAYFEQEVLYDLQPKKEMGILLDLIQEKPSHHAWTIFG